MNQHVAQVLAQPPSTNDGAALELLDHLQVHLSCRRFAANVAPDALNYQILPKEPSPSVLKGYE